MRTDSINDVIIEMINRFLEIDLKAIKAQTHATLTACRGLIRYAEITGDSKYIEEAEKRFLLFKSDGMTENFENYNWFDRYDTWSEPCSIVDAYMVAMQLWQHTRNSEYRDDAEMIYYNGLCHTQRYNGGFGCDNRPGIASAETALKIHVDEAHWCCTMRGGEGLSKAAQYSYFVQNNVVYVTQFRNSKISNGSIAIEQATNYPFDNGVTFTIKENSAQKITLKIAKPKWIENIVVRVNNEKYNYKAENGFIAVTRKFHKGDIVKFDFSMSCRVTKTQNNENSTPDQLRVFYGPLMLGAEGRCNVKLNKNDIIERIDTTRFSVVGKDVILTPIYHLMDFKVRLETGYMKQILF